MARIEAANFENLDRYAQSILEAQKKTWGASSAQSPALRAPPVNLSAVCAVCGLASKPQD